MFGHRRQGGPTWVVDMGARHGGQHGWSIDQQPWTAQFPIEISLRQVQIFRPKKLFTFLLFTFLTLHFESFTFRNCLGKVTFTLGDIQCFRNFTLWNLHVMKTYVRLCLQLIKLDFIYSALPTNKIYLTFWGITTHPWHPKGPRIWKLAKKNF